MDGLRQDIHFALRQVARTPLLSVVAVLVLAVGIGTNTVVVSVLDGIFFRAPPGVGEIDGLIEISSIPTQGRRGTPELTYDELLAYRDQRSVFSEVAVYRPARVALRTDRGLETARAELASSGYFAALRLRMELGTGFVPGDDRPIAGGGALAVLGHAFWLRRMDGSTDVLGRTIEVNGRPYTVVGVATERFHGAGGGDDPVALWLPAADQPVLFPEEEDLLTGGRRAFRAVARLEEGVTAARAQAVANATWRAVAEGAALPGGDDARRIEVTPYRGIGSNMAEGGFGFVSVVGGLVGGIILLIACANASGLLLARGLRRRREIGIRLAVGAGRRRVVRQLLTESTLLAAVAGAAGLLLTFRVLDGLERGLFTFPVDLEPSLVAVILTLCVTTVTGVASGLAPALHATRASVFTAMKDRVAGGGLRSSRMRDGFTVAQLALSLPLLTAAGLIVGQLLTRARGDFGVRDPRSVVTLRVGFDQARHSAEEMHPLLTRIRERVAALPGVSDAAFTGAAPFVGGEWSSFGRIRLPSEGDGAGPSNERTLVHVAAVDPEYFGTMGIPILRGRGIQPSDLPGTPSAAVIDEDLARRAWPGEEPLGRTLTFETAGGERTATVVGVAGPVRMWASASTPTHVIYGSRFQMPDTTSMILVARTVGDAGVVASESRAAIRAVDSDLVVDVELLDDALRASRIELSHASAGAAACGLVALLLACIGLYAIIAAGVGERTREIGVRMALGADRGHVIGQFVRRGLGLALMAVGVGLPLSWVVVALVGSRVVGVRALEPAVPAAFAVVTILMMVVAFVSSWLPARRSSSVDPVLALRAD